MTITEALAFGTAALRAAGIEHAEHDAELLLRHVLGWDRARLIVESASALAPRPESSFRRPRRRTGRGGVRSNT